jgi:hypothetical protein
MYVLDPFQKTVLETWYGDISLILPAILSADPVDTMAMKSMIRISADPAWPNR